MTFTLTQSHLDSIVALLREGDIKAFLAHVEPEVEWRMGASDEPGKGGPGMYTLARFQEYIVPVMGKAFEPGVFKHPCQEVDMIGNKAIIEDFHTVPMKNGDVYKNRECIVLEFSKETGKINKMRAYVDTAVMDAARRAHGIEVPA